MVGVVSAMPNPVATFKTSVGQFSAEIYLDRVPITASNFIDLCQTGMPALLALVLLEIHHFCSTQASTMVSTSTESFPTL